jgi:predicted TIM-barrel fold metal-dependent hydrolase
MLRPPPARPFEGTLDRFPKLKICSVHGGGCLPSYAPRSDNSLRVAPDMDTGVKLKKKPTEYLRQMYYDTLVFTSEALRHLAAEVGSSHGMDGFDKPWPGAAIFGHGRRGESLEGPAPARRHSNRHGPRRRLRDHAEGSGD